MSRCGPADLRHGELSRILLVLSLQRKHEMCRLVQFALISLITFFKRRQALTVYGGEFCLLSDQLTVTASCGFDRHRLFWAVHWQAAVLAAVASGRKRGSCRVVGRLTSDTASCRAYCLS